MLIVLKGRLRGRKRSVHLCLGVVLGSQTSFLSFSPFPPQSPDTLKMSLQVATIFPFHRAWPRCHFLIDSFPDHSLQASPPNYSLSSHSVIFIILTPTSFIYVYFKKNDLSHILDSNLQSLHLFGSLWFIHDRILKEKALNRSLIA